MTAKVTGSQGNKDAPLPPLYWEEQAGRQEVSQQKGGDRTEGDRLSHVVAG